MQNDFNCEDIEFALYILHHQKLLAEPKVRAWLEVKEHRDLLEGLRRYREAGMREKGGMEVDEEYQWFLLDERITLRASKIRIRRRMMKFVASVLVLISVTMAVYYQQRERQFIQPMELTRNTEKNTVTLITEGGKKYFLASGTGAEDSLNIRGVVIDSVGGMKYMRVLRDDCRPEEFHTIKVPRGGEYILILDDGTRAWINSDSELRYPLAFSGAKREVFLKGEAYFDVKREEDRPFVVATTRTEVNVLGTEFNVQSYENGVENITLIKGVVSVKEEGTGADHEVVLKPGENVSLRDGLLHVEEVDVLEYTSWKEGFFYYNNIRLEDILDELGRWFDFTVFYRNPEAKDFRFKFWANRKDTVEQVIGRLNETGKLRIEVTGKTVIVFI